MDAISGDVCFIEIFECKRVMNSALFLVALIGCISICGCVQDRCNTSATKSDNELEKYWTPEKIHETESIPFPETDIDPIETDNVNNTDDSNESNQTEKKHE